MAEIEHAAALRHPLPFAFATVADVVRWPAFWPSCRSASWIDRSGEEGLLALVLDGGLLRRLSLRARLSLAPGRVRLDMEPPSDLWIELLLRDEGGGTLVDLRAAPAPLSRFTLIGPGVTWLRATGEFLPALRRRLDDLAWSPERAEERPPVPLILRARG